MKANEAPVSEIDFEQELYKYFGQVKDFTLGMRIAKRFYEIGRNYQEPVSEQKLSNVGRIGKNWKEPVSEDLEEEICMYINQGISDEEHLKDLNDVAHHFANWQKEQMIKDAVKARFTLLDGFCIDRELYKNYKVGGKYKLIIIKED